MQSLSCRRQSRAVRMSRRTPWRPAPSTSPGRCSGAEVPRRVARRPPDLTGPRSARPLFRAGAVATRRGELGRQADGGSCRGRSVLAAQRVTLSRWMRCTLQSVVFWCMRICCHGGRGSRDFIFSRITYKPVYYRAPSSTAALYSDYTTRGIAWRKSSNWC
jgi:hypothetical protein